MKYYVYTDVDKSGFGKVNARVLFACFDRKDQCILISEKFERVIEPFTYNYAVDNELDYRWCMFKMKDPHTVTPLELKLLETFHHEWFNAMHEYLLSKAFAEPLVKIHNLRLTSEVYPDKQDMFVPFKERIKDTIIPTSITEGHEEIWKDFIDRTTNVQKTYMDNRKKFDY